jgi:hypothetical protein
MTILTAQGLQSPIAEGVLAAAVARLGRRGEVVMKRTD